MVVQGEDVVLVPVEGARDVAANIPGAEFRLLPGLGHVLPPAMVPDIVDAITSAASRATGAKPGR